MNKITEQIAIETIRKNHCTNNEHCTDSCMHGVEFCAYAMAIKVLEEKITSKEFNTIKVGDVVYAAYKEVVPCRVSMVTQKADESFKFRLTPPDGFVFEVKQSDFGTRVFLTEEEARQNLQI